jgi:hypothetical protein
MMGSKYYFEFPDKGKDFSYAVEEEIVEGKAPLEGTAAFPAWTRLECHRCSHCPLAVQYVPYCPPALNMVKLVEKFSDCNSFEPVTLHVVNGVQKHSTTTDLQTALAYLYPVILLRSACPYAPLLRPMEKFIKPFPDLEDALFYSLSFELIKKRLFDGGFGTSNVEDECVSKDFYNIAMAFHGLLNRLRAASHNDANINAIIKDIQWSYNILHSQESILDRLKPYFTEDIGPTQS